MKPADRGLQYGLHNLLTEDAKAEDANLVKLCNEVQGNNNAQVNLTSPADEIRLRAIRRREENLQTNMQV